MAPTPSKRLSRQSLIKASLRLSAASKRAPLISGKRKFLKHSDRVKRARTLTGRSVATNEADLNAVPSGGILSCFLKDAIEEENMRNPSAPYSQFYREIYSMVQSQALLVHNHERIIDLITHHLGRLERIDESMPLQLRKHESAGIPSILNVIQVLCKDLPAGTLYSHIFKLMDACLKLVDVTDVDLTTHVFQTIGKLFERCAVVILENDPKLDFQTKLYPTYLGHSSVLIRNLAAETFSFLVRHQQVAERKRHVWSLLKAPAETYSAGVSLLLTYVVRGVQGKFHTNMAKILASALHTAEKNQDGNKANDVKENIFSWTENLREYSHGVDDLRFLNLMIKICSESSSPQWTRFLFSLVAPWFKRFRCEDNVEQVVDQLIQHVEASLSSDDCDSDTKETILAFAVDLWSFIAHELEDNEHLSTKLGEVLARCLIPSAEDVSDEFFLNVLSELDFLSHFVPYVLPQLSHHAGLEVWTEVSRSSAKVFGESPSTWKQAMNFELETKRTFSETTGRLSALFVSRSLQPLMEKAMKQVDEVSLKFLCELDPSEMKGSSICDFLRTSLERLEDERLIGWGWKAFAVHGAAVDGGKKKWMENFAFKCLQSKDIHVVLSAPGLEALQLLLPLSLSASEVAFVVEKICQRLSSNDMFVRRAGLNVLFALFPQSESIKLMREIHELEPTFESDRPRKILADSLAQVMKGKLERHELAAMLHGTLGIFQVRFQPAWGVATSLLSTLSSLGNGDLLWKLGLGSFLCRYAAFIPVDEGVQRTFTTPDQVFQSLIESITSSQSLLKMIRRESAAWIPAFFQFMREEFYATRRPDDLLLQEIPEDELPLGKSANGEANQNEEDEAEEDDQKEEDTMKSSVTFGLAKKKLLSWLSLFKSLTALGGELASIDMLTTVWTRLLILDDCALVCTQCLINVNKARLDKARTVLENLAETKAEGFKDVVIELTEAIGVFRQEPLFITISTRLLFGKLTQRQGKRERFSVSQRRSAVFSAFASLAENQAEESLGVLFDLMLRPFVGKSEEKSVLESRSSAVEGFLSLLKDAIRVLGKRMMPFVDKIVDALCLLLKESCLDSFPAESRANAVRAKIRSESLERMAEVIERFSPEFDFTRAFEKQNLGTVLNVTSQYVVTATEQPSSLLHLVATCLQASQQTRWLLLNKGGCAFERFLLRIEISSNGEVLNIIFNAIREVLEQDGGGDVLVPYLPLFLASFAKRQSVGGAQELEILATVSRQLIPKALSSAISAAERAKVCELSAELMVILGEFINKRPAKTDEERDARSYTIETMLALGSELPKESKALVGEKLLPALIKLFGPWAEGNEISAGPVRQLLAQLYVIVNVKGKHSNEENVWMEGLNTFVMSRLTREPDYEKRLGVYHQLISKIECGEFRANRYVIINQALFDMTSSDFALRTAAQTFSSTFVNSLKVLDAMLVDLLSHAMQTSLKLQKNLSIRGGFMTLLKDISLAATRLGDNEQTKSDLGADLSVLINEENPDVDFFLNAAHMQNSRRGRVFNRLAHQIDDGSVVLSKETIRKYLIPIALHGVFVEGASLSDTESGMALVKSCAERLDDFGSFCTLLESVLKRVTKATSRVQTRVLLRCACSILDAFPLVNDEASYAALKQRFLARFFGMLIIPKSAVADEELSESVALSLARLCRDQEEQLDNLILQICGQLKRRKQSARDAARSALRRVARFLGAEHFPRVLGHLTSTLRDGGYIVHVLGYTVHVLVDGLKEDLKTTREGGESEEMGFEEFRRTGLDDVVDDIVRVIEVEIFNEGAPTEENGYKSKLKLREQRAGKAGDTLEALASCIGFLPCDSIHKLTRPFTSRLKSRALMLDPKIINKCRDGFTRIRSGLLHNNDVRPEHLLIYVHTILDNYISSRKEREEKESGKALKSKSWHVNAAEDEDDQNNVVRKGGAYHDRLLYERGVQLTGKSAERLNRNGNQGGDGSSAEHLFVEFALSLLQNGFFRAKKQQQQQTGQVEEDVDVITKHASMLAPLVELLVREVIMKDAASKRALVLSLRICNKLVEEGANESLLPMGLVNMLSHRLLKFVRQNSVSSAIVSTDVCRASVELISNLLDQPQYSNLFNVDDVKLLIRVARLDLDDVNRVSVALKLLKCVFDRKLLLPELYDVALQLSRLVFQSSRWKDRNTCASLVCQFLLDFPLEDKRIQEQIDLIMKNLDFPEEAGRVAGLNMLKACISRFPTTLIDDQLEFYFLPLTMRLVNDDAPTVKEACVKTILSLVNRASQKKMQRIADLVLGWFDKPQTLPAACHCGGVIIESGRVTSQPVAGRICQALVKVVEERLQANDDSNEWQILYQSIVSLEKAMDKKAIGETLVQMDELLVDLLVHPHGWIRLASGRVLARRLEAFAKEKQEIKQMSSHRLTGFDVMLALVDQLDSDVLADEMALLVTQNMLKLVLISEYSPKWFDSSSEEKNPRAWLVKRLALIASRPEKDNLELKNKRRRAVFTVFLDICGGNKAEGDLEDDEVASAMIRGVTTLHTAALNAREADPLVDMCDQVLDALKKVVGADRFVRLLNDVRAHKMEKKMLKKKAQVLAKVMPQDRAFPKRLKTG